MPPASFRSSPASGLPIVVVPRSHALPATLRQSLEREEIIMARKYSPLAGKKVKKAMHEMKHGKLKSGKSQKRVTNPKQAIAIGLSEARKRGARVPAKKGS